MPARILPPSLANLAGGISGPCNGQQWLDDWKRQRAADSAAHPGAAAGGGASLAGP